MPEQRRVIRTKTLEQHQHQTYASWWNTNWYVWYRKSAFTIFRNIWNKIMDIFNRNNKEGQTWKYIVVKSSDDAENPKTQTWLNSRWLVVRDVTTFLLLLSFLLQFSKSYWGNRLLNRMSMNVGSGVETLVYQNYHLLQKLIRNKKGVDQGNDGGSFRGAGGESW